MTKLSLFLTKYFLYISHFVLIICGCFSCDYSILRNRSVLFLRRPFGNTLSKSAVPLIICIHVVLCIVVCSADFCLNCIVSYVNSQLNRSRFLKYCYLSVKMHSINLHSFYGSGTDPTSLLVLLLFVFGWRCLKNIKLRHFKSGRDEIWCDCFSSKYASIDRVSFLIWWHTFKISICTYMHI